MESADNIFLLLILIVYELLDDNVGAAHILSRRSRISGVFSSIWPIFIITNQQQPRFRRAEDENYFWTFINQVARASSTRAHIQKTRDWAPNWFMNLNYVEAQRCRRLSIFVIDCFEIKSDRFIIIELSFALATLNSERRRNSLATMFSFLSIVNKVNEEELNDSMKVDKSLNWLSSWS